MSKCKITGKVLSVQLGREETRIALIAGGSEILHSVTLMTPTGAVEDGEIRNAEAVRDMLKKALRAPEFKRVRQAVFTLCTTQVITSDPQTVPDLPEAKLEKLVAANVDTYFPVDIQDYNVVWQVIGPKTSEGGLKEQEIKLWAVPKSILSRYYAVANAAGLSVAAVDYCGHSVATAVGASFAKPGKKAAKAQKGSVLSREITFGKKKETAEPAPASPVATEARTIPDTQLHISAEKDFVGMTFVQEGQVVMQRFIPCGANMTDVLGEVAMIGEYYRTLDAGRGSRIQGIISGGLAWDRQLTADLEDMLGVDLKVYEGKCDAQWVMCLGAGSTTLDFGLSSLNAPGKARKQVQSQIWQYALILAGGLALMGVILLTLSSRLAWNSNIKSLEAAQQTLAIRAQQTAGYADNYNNYASSFDSYSADWDTVFASLQTYNDNLVLVLEELEKVMPDKASVVNMQIAQDGMSVQFACEDKAVAAYLIMALRELQYADLTAISNLSGGGSGAATGYAPKSSGTTEAAPTEGSFDPALASDSAVMDLIAGELTEQELMELAFGMTDQEFALLEQVYGSLPINNYASLADLKSVNAQADAQKFFVQRTEALRTMLTGNPFAMNRFMNLMEEDFERDEEAILWWHILADLIALEKEGAFGNGSVDDIDSLREYIDILVSVLAKDETTLSATEQLICTDPVEEKWYVYYLEVQMGIRAEEPFVFLDMEKIVEDLLSGGFNTGDPTLDAKLNALISDEAWAKLEELTSAEGIAEMLDKFLTNGTTGDPDMDALIYSYLTTGTTGYDRLDQAIDEYIASGALDARMAQLLNSYLTTGTTGNATVDELVNRYLIAGTTGNAQIDAVIANYIASGDMDENIAVLFDKYLTAGTTGSPTVDLLIENYLAAGTTGNSMLDGAITRYLSSGRLDATLAQLLDKYASNGTTGVAAVDALIERYLVEGTTGNAALDAVIESYISTVAGSITSEQIAQLIKSYMETGSTGNKLYDILLTRYMTEGTTGNATLDAMIEAYLKGSEGGESGGFTEEQIKALLEKYMKEGTTGNPLYDSLIEKYINTGTTGVAELDALIESYMDTLLGAITEDEIKALLDNFLKDGTTGNHLYDKLINKYLRDGTTGIAKLDQLISDYFGSGDGSGETDSWKAMLEKFIKEGTTGNDWYDDLIMNYFKTGTTGNDALDAAIEACIDEMIASITAQELADMVNSYLSTGTTGNKLIDLVIWTYLENGTTNNQKLDALILNAITANLTQDMVEELVNKYLTSGTTGNALYDQLIKKYLETGTTGNSALDKLIKEYLTNAIVGGEITGDDLESLLGSLLGGTTGDGTQSADTRIFFTVSLAYNDNLKNAELIRKGLDYTDKIQKLEVEEE